MMGGRKETIPRFNCWLNGRKEERKQLFSCFGVKPGYHVDFEA